MVRLSVLNIGIGLTSLLFSQFSVAQALTLDEFVKSILVPLIGFDTIELGAPAFAVLGLIMVVWGSHVVFE